MYGVRGKIDHWLKSIHHNNGENSDILLQCKGSRNMVLYYSKGCAGIDTRWQLHSTEWGSMRIAPPLYGKDSK